MHRYMFLVLSSLALPSTGQDQSADLRSAAWVLPIANTTRCEDG